MTRAARTRRPATPTPGVPFAGEQEQVIMQALRSLAPTLHQHPELLAEARHMLAQADARAVALKAAPTGSQSVAAGGAAGSWAGMHAHRTAARGVANADFLRRLATKNPWVHAAITIRKQQIGRADIAVIPADETKTYNKQVQRQVEQLLNFPNEYRDSYRSLMEPVIDDILVLDRGCISKNMDARRIPHGLYVEDGATIKIFADWSGDPKQPRYLYAAPDGMTTVPLRNDELICIMANAASYRYGLSPVQVLLDTIRADLAATDKAMNLVQDVPPPHLISIKGASQQAISDLRGAYDQDVAGKREVFFMGTDGDLHVYPLMFSLKDNQFLEWQTYLARKICACFLISPQQIGLTFDVNKATASSQQDIYEDTGLIPLLLLIEEYLNRELLTDFAPVARDGRPNMEALNLRILYPEVSELSRMLHAERVLKLAAGGLGALPLLTPNMALAMLGAEPVDGGNTFWVMTKDGPMPWLSYDGETGDYGTFDTAGVLGAQDALGGVDEDEEAPRVAAGKGDRSTPTPTGAPATGTTPPQSPTGTAPSEAAPSDAPTVAQWARRNVRRVDTRQPGKLWHASAGDAVVKAPRSLGRVPRDVADGYHQPHGHVKAQASLAAEVKRIFEEAYQRGHHAG